jgi:hypothetical protein
MTDAPLARVEQACTNLAAAGRPVTFTAVAAAAGVGRATLYRDPQLRAVVEEHRTHQADARTLSGLTAEIAHLRTAVEALAGTVKRQEERLRRLERHRQEKVG